MVLDGGQPSGLGKRQRLEQQRVDDGEDRGVDADADGQRDEGDEREARRLAQHAERVAQVADEGLEHAAALFMS